MRLFIAIPIPEDLKIRLQSVSTGLRGAKWVRWEGMHVTLKFLGEVDSETARDVDAELDAISFPPFDLKPNGFGYFERGHRIHMVWAGFQPCDALAALQAKIDAAALRAGFARDNRKFKAHVTLGRLKNGRADDVGAWLVANEHHALPPFTVERFALYRSHLAREGAMYEELAEYML